MDHFFAAVAGAQYHEDGQQADGVHPRAGVPAVTFEPGLSIYGPIRIDGDGPFEDLDPTGCGQCHVAHQTP